MLRHIVMWKFRPGTESERDAFLRDLAALQGVIPSLLHSEVHRGISGDWDAVLVSEFADAAGLEAYKTDPRHQAVSARCKAIRTDRASIDYIP